MDAGWRGSCKERPEKVLVTASGNAAEGFSRGASGEGGTRLAGRDLETNAALPRAVSVV